MFLAMALIVCLASVFIEVKLVNSVPFLEKIYTQGIFGIPGAWVNNICSLGISAVFGLVFQATGIAIFVGGMLSIPVSNIYFSSKYKLNSNGITLASVKQSMNSKTEEVGNWWSENGHYFSELGKTIMLCIKVVTFPVRALVKANTAAHQGHGKIIETKGRLTNSAVQIQERWQSHKAA
jgi:hypothetical protein